MIRMYTDAAVKGNPGPAGVGLLIIFDKEQKQITFPLEGTWNNHHAEFKAMQLGLKWLSDQQFTDEMVFCYTDSKIVAQSVEKKYVKNSVAANYLSEILTLMEQFSFISVKWIPESDNKGADHLARQALQKTFH